jgi:hypothetical protein
MVQLAKQLIDRQTTKYDASDLEDCYETRLRAMIDAKLKGEGIDLSEPAESESSNVIDLMAALKKSVGEAGAGCEEAREGSQADRLHSLQSRHLASAPEFLAGRVGRRILSGWIPRSRASIGCACCKIR